MSWLPMLFEAGIKPRGNATTLVVVAHGFGTAGHHLNGVIQQMKEAIPDSDVLAPRWRWFSLLDPTQIAEAMLEAISRLVRERERLGGGYQRIVLVGHSTGTLILRKALVYACGQYEDGPRRPQLRTREEWVDRVDRVVLLAGMNRGWTLDPKSPHMSWMKWLWLKVLSTFFNVTTVGQLCPFKLRRGSPFVVNLELQWHALALRSDVQVPDVIQILGDRDDVVSHKDNLNLYGSAVAPELMREAAAQLPHGEAPLATNRPTSSRFVFLTTFETDHRSILEIDATDAGKYRAERIKQAVGAPVESLESTYEPPLYPNPHVAHVVFVMHGIRDYGDWTQRCRRTVQRTAEDMKLVVEVNTSGYGYFPMGLFLIPFARQKNVRWFMDQYASAVTRYPLAVIDFIGHSNGTYLAATALQRYAATRFNNMAFAGSVVPRGFPWDDLVAQGRVRRFRNDIATSDWVVGIFPNLFDSFSDIGGGGFWGFLDDQGQRNVVQFHPGGHGAALADENLASMAHFALTGQLKLGRVPLEAARSQIVEVLSKLNLLVWVSIVATISLVGRYIMQGWHISLAFHPPGWWVATYAGLVLLLLLRI